MKTRPEKPLLSICIPTYNRAKYLKKSLKTIISQEEFQDGIVEVVVSDNASDDETESLVKRYMDSYSNIFFCKNEKNVLDANFPKVLSEGHGTYRRLCNDTLLFRKGSLKYICELIKANEKRRPFISWANGIKSCNKEIKSVDFQNYVRILSFQMTAISCFGLWENECEQIENDLDGSELRLWQVRKGLELAHHNEKIVIVNKKLTNIQNVEKKDISYGLYQIFFQNYFKLLSPYYAQDLISEDLKEYLEKDLLYNFFTIWCIRWELGEKRLLYSNSEDLKSAIFQHYKEKPYWWKYYFYYNGKKTKELMKRAIKKIIRKES